MAARSVPTRGTQRTQQNARHVYLGEGGHRTELRQALSAGRPTRCAESADALSHRGRTRLALQALWAEELAPLVSVIKYSPPILEWAAQSPAKLREQREAERTKAEIALREAEAHAREVAEQAVKSAVAAGNGQALREAFTHNLWVMGGGLNADNGGILLLAKAIRDGAQEVVDVLLEFGANPNGTLDGSLTVLMCAILIKNTTAVASLLSYGARPNEQSDEVWPPLVQAAAAGEEEIVRLLLQAGAQHDAADSRGHTALKWATVRGFENIAQLLREQCQQFVDPLGGVWQEVDCDQCWPTEARGLGGANTPLGTADAEVHEAALEILADCLNTAMSLQGVPVTIHRP